MDAQQRKLLFILFNDDACRVNHALRYAIDLHNHGTATVQIIVEGPATAILGRVQDQGSTTAQLFRQAIDLELVAGACRTASAGCNTGDLERKVTETVEDLGLKLIGDLDGHTTVEPYVRDGYELVAF